MIDGSTILFAHVGYPTKTFKAPLIYNPWFERKGINAVVVPMAVEACDFHQVFAALARVRNMRGALVTMPHKITASALVTELSPSARIAGACNAVLFRPGGATAGDMFDGEGFVRGMIRKGRSAAGASAFIAGSGGVGSAIAASLAAAGVARLRLYDRDADAAATLAARLRRHYPALAICTGNPDPQGSDIVVNATPLGMNAGDPLPLDVDRISPEAFVGEVVLSEEMTPLLRAARARGCVTQVGTDMLFEQIPAYLAFFGFPEASVEELREIARLGR